MKNENRDKKELIVRIKALIAKAESTEFPAEADAFMAKAQLLIDRYAIDEANLAGVDPSEVSHESLDISGSYSAERCHIYTSVAEVNRCKILTIRSFRSSKVDELILVGRQSDRELVKLMAISLEAQALDRMASMELDPTLSVVVQRRSFLRGFAYEVLTRLQANAALKAHGQPGGAHNQPGGAGGFGGRGGSGRVRAALILIEDAIDEYIYEEFDASVGRARQVRSDPRAYGSGLRAGANADVGATRVAGNMRSLPPSK